MSVCLHLMTNEGAPNNDLLMLIALSVTDSLVVLPG
jgi:hypothetical protein